MRTPETDSITKDPTGPTQAREFSNAPVAPVWHTVILILGIAALSIQSAMQFSGPQPAINRLQTYVLTAGTELGMLAWIYFGLRLRKIPFGSLFGSVPKDLRSTAVELGFALVFWLGSLMILGTIGAFWTIAEAAIAHRSLFPNGNQLAPDPTQQQTIHTLSQLVPTNGREIAAWILLCIVAGIAEETIFRGYLQRQFTAWTRGAVVAALVFSSLLFGAAHGYQSVRNMVLLAVFGALFSLLALLRRSLFAGMFAHSWHDLIAGLMLALLKAHHVV